MRRLFLTGIIALSLSLVMPMAAWADDENKETAIAAQIETMKEAFIGALEEPKTMYANQAGVNIRDKPDIKSAILD